eukprot:SAG31_NODE_7526_length_1665_cov_3.363346_2_plen_117_part_00
MKSFGRLAAEAVVFGYIWQTFLEFNGMRAVHFDKFLQDLVCTIRIIFKTELHVPVAPAGAASSMLELYPILHSLSVFHSQCVCMTFTLKRQYPDTKFLKNTAVLNLVLEYEYPRVG